MTNDTNMKKKILHYLMRCDSVHVTKDSGYFYNGIFMSDNGDDTYTFKDRKLGEITLFGFEIKDIEPYQALIRV